MHSLVTVTFSFHNRTLTASVFCEIVLHYQSRLSWLFPMLKHSFGLCRTVAAGVTEDEACDRYFLLMHLMHYSVHINYPTVDLQNIIQ
jgi:hypothetical protein